MDAAVDGQIEGGVLMGRGCALCEDMLMVDGKLVTPTQSPDVDTIVAVL